MNKENNKRRQQSRTKIEKVFVELLQTKELSEISVSEICKLVPVNRTTFYAIYDDIYALADSIRDGLEKMMRELYREERTEGYNSNNYLRLFQHIKENQLLYRTYFKLGYDNNDQITCYDWRLAEEHFDNKFIEYHIEFFKSGLNSVIKMWLANGCQETPEEMFGIIKAEYQGRPEFFGMDAQE